MYDTSLGDRVKFALKIAPGCPIIIHCDIAAIFLLGLHLKLENVKLVKKMMYQHDITLLHKYS